jgi:hypothetical protein
MSSGRIHYSKETVKYQLTSKRCAYERLQTGRKINSVSEENCKVKPSCYMPWRHLGGEEV